MLHKLKLTIAHLRDASPVSKKLFLGGTWALAGKILAMLAGFAVSAVLARLLPPRDLGAYFLVLSIVSTSVFVAQAGLSWTATRLIAESMGTSQPGRARQVIRLTFRLGAVTALGVAGLLFFGGARSIALVVFHSESIANLSGGISVLVVLMVFQSFIVEIFRGFHDIWLATAFGNLGTNFLSMVIFWAYWHFFGQGNLLVIIVLFIIVQFLIVLAGLLSLTGRLSKLPSTGSSIAAREILLISWGVWGTHLMMLAWSQSDLWIVGSYRSALDVALYGAALRMIALVNMPLVVANSVLPPIISELFSQRRMVELEKALRSVATITAAPSIVFLSILGLFSREILTVVFGEYYESAWVVLVLLSCGQMVNVLAGSCGLALIYTGHHLTLMKITFVSVLISVVGSLLLIQPLGIVGVAIAAMTGTCAQNALALVSTRRRLSIWTHATFRLSSFNSLHLPAGDR